MKKRRLVILAVLSSVVVGGTILSLQNYTGYSTEEATEHKREATGLLKGTRKQNRKFCKSSKSKDRICSNRLGRN